MMKNLKCFILMFLFLFTTITCSLPEEDPIVLPLVEGTIKSIREKTYYLSQAVQEISQIFYYNGEKLVAVDNSISSLVFFYNENKIVNYNIETNLAIISDNTISYDGNFMKTIINIGITQKTEFFYQNGILNSIKEYSKSGSTPWNLLESNNLIFNSNQNIEQKILITTNGGIISESKSSFEFDDKNSPFKNMNKYTGYLLDYETFDPKNKNNIVKQYGYSDINATTPLQSHYYSYVYNQNNFPISIKKYAFGSNTLLSECTIVYN